MAIAPKDRSSESVALSGREPAIADENDSLRPARLGSLKDRSCRESDRLHPADGEDRRAAKPMPFVEEERQRDVPPAMPEKLGGELRRRCRAVDAARKRERSVPHDVRVNNPELTETERAKDAGRGWDHRGALQ